MQLGFRVGAEHRPRLLSPSRCAPECSWSCHPAPHHHRSRPAAVARADRRERFLRRVAVVRSLRLSDPRRPVATTGRHPPRAPRDTAIPDSVPRAICATEFLESVSRYRISQCSISREGEQSCSPSPNRHRRTSTCAAAPPAARSGETGARRHVPAEIVRRRRALLDTGSPPGCLLGVGLRTRFGRRARSWSGRNLTRRPRRIAGKLLHCAGGCLFNQTVVGVAHDRVERLRRTGRFELGSGERWQPREQ